MFIKLKDFACSSRGSISALSADITQKRHYISTKSADMTTLVAISVELLKYFKRGYDE